MSAFADAFSIFAVSAVAEAFSALPEGQAE
jgi:hypothetical protein